MRTLMGILVSLGLVLAMIPAAGAQDAQVSYVPDVGSAVVWVDAAQNDVATLIVTEVNLDFREYGDNRQPGHGYKYQALQLVFENVSDNSVIIEPSTIELIDDHGRNHRSSTMYDIGPLYEALNDAVPLAPGESVEAVLVFETPAHADAALLSWKPARDQTLLVNLIEERVFSRAVAFGLHETAIYSDNFANRVANIEVKNIERDWSGYGEREEADEGYSYLAVHVQITNVSDRDLLVEPYHFELLDSSGFEDSVSWARGDDDADPMPQRDGVIVAPGETEEVMFVFDLADGREPVALIWNQGWASRTHNFFDEESGPPIPTPIAMPSY